MHKVNLSRLLMLLFMTTSCLFIFGATVFAQDAPPNDEHGATVVEPGVLIVAVSPDSPAAAAGLQRGNIVLRVGDIEVNDATALREAILAAAPDETVTLTVLHGDETREIEVTLGDRNGGVFLGVTPYIDRMIDPGLRGNGPIQPGQPGTLPGPRFMVPGDATPAIPGDMDPISLTLTVVDVMADSPAEAAGLKAGDTISAIDESALSSPRDLVEQIQALAPGDTIMLTVQHADGTEETIEVALGAHPDDAERAYLGVQVAADIRVERFGPGTQDGQQHRFFAHPFDGPRGFWFERRQGPGNDGSENNNDAEQRQEEQFQRRFFFHEPFDGPRGHRGFRRQGPIRRFFHWVLPDFSHPDPDGFFQWDAPTTDEDVIIIRRFAPNNDMNSAEQAEEHLELRYGVPGGFTIEGELPMDPQIEEIHIEIVDDVI